MILTGDPIPAARAAEIGLVNTVVVACLRAVTRGINLPVDEGLAVEAACCAATVPTDGVRNGLRRFLDRTAASR